MLLINTAQYNHTIKYNACVGPTIYFIYKIRVWLVLVLVLGLGLGFGLGLDYGLGFSSDRITL